MFLYLTIPVSIGNPEHFPVSMVAIPLHSRVHFALLVEKLKLFWSVKRDQMAVQITELRANLHCFLK